MTRGVNCFEYRKKVVINFNQALLPPTVVHHVSTLQQHASIIQPNFILKPRDYSPTHPEGPEQVLHRFN